MTFSDFMGLLSQLSLEALTPPTTFSEQVKASRDLLKNDTSGFVKPLVDFAVTAATRVNFSISTENDVLDNLFDKILKELNSDFVGKVNLGLNPIKKDFFRSYWDSGLCVIKTVWNEVDGLIVPKTAFLVDSKSVKVEGDDNKFASYKYYLDDKELRNTDYTHIFIYKNSSMYEKYPTPPLISKGVYINVQIKKVIKALQRSYLDQIIPFLWIILKGEKSRPDLKYNKEDLQDIKTALEKAIKEFKEDKLNKKIPLAVSRFDTKHEFLTPDLEKMLDDAITSSINKDILAGMGFISVLEGLSTRRDIVLNPRPFINNVVDSVLLFKNFINDLAYVTAKKNIEHKKYFTNFSYSVNTTPLTSFWNDNDKSIMRILSDRGLLSIKTSLENFDIDFNTELKRRSKEAENGSEVIFFPRVLMNQEAQESLLEMQHYDLETEPETTTKNTKSILKDTTPDKQGVDRFDYKFSEKVLELTQHLAPYKNWKSIPLKLRKTLRTIKSRKLREVWLTTFNNSWVYYKETHPEEADSLAAKTAWNMVKKMGKKVKGGWVLKEKYRK